jgi:hypothetical protein
MKFRVEYFDNGTVKAVEASGDNLEDVRAKFHGKKVLAVCVMEDYKALYQPQLNALRSEFVKYCPKPIQNGK